MRSIKMIAFGMAVLVCSVMIGVAAPAAKSYQVTGKVTEATGAKIVVEKADGEKWELSRSAETKCEGELKVGEKVTISYTMVAKSVTLKDEAAADKKAEKKEESKSAK